MSFFESKLEDFAAMNRTLEALIKDTQSNITGTRENLEAFIDHIISDIS